MKRWFREKNLEKYLFYARTGNIFYKNQNLLVHNISLINVSIATRIDKRSIIIDKMSGEFSEYAFLKSLTVQSIHINIVRSS